MTTILDIIQRIRLYESIIASVYVFGRMATKSVTRLD